MADSDGEEKIMSHRTYRCYFTDADDRIMSCEEIACMDDSTAALKVDELLARSRHGSAELWQGERLVGRWTANEQTIETATGK